MKKILIGICIFSSVFLVWCQKEWSNIWEIQPQTITGIQSFEDCKNTGFPIMESIPRQCNDGITTFTEDSPQNISWEIQTWSEDIDQQAEILIDTWSTGTILENNEQENTDNDSESIKEKFKMFLQNKTQKTQVNEQTEPIQNIDQPTNEKVTEDDIEKLENIIDNIISE